MVERKAKKFFKLEFDNSNVQRLRRLLFDRIDAAIFSPGRASLNFEIKKINSIGKEHFSKEQFTILEKPLVQDPNHLAFAKQLHMKEFLSLFNKVIKKGYESGVIPKIISKY